MFSVQILLYSETRAEDRQEGDYTMLFQLGIVIIAGFIIYSIIKFLPRLWKGNRPTTSEEEAMPIAKTASATVKETKTSPDAPEIAEAPAADRAPLDGFDRIRAAKPGDEIQFGMYSQRILNRHPLTMPPEPIVWRVLAKEGNSLLVVSKFAQIWLPYTDSVVNSKPSRKQL